MEHAVREAKRRGIARVHGFFVIGSPDETAEDIMESFRCAARLELDTFGFNRLCAYRGTPLWQTSDIVKLLGSPFRRRTLTRKPELPARMIDAGLEEPDRQMVWSATRPHDRQCHDRQDGDDGQERRTKPLALGDYPERSA